MCSKNFAIPRTVYS